MRAEREPVVRAGLKLLDEVGLDGLTLRRIAAEIGVQAPTLYWRFKNKQDLIDEMATQVFADWADEFEAEAALSSWRDLALAFGRGLHKTLLRYRDGARMMGGSYLTDAKLYGRLEAALGVFAASGVKPADTMACLMTIYAYVLGFTIEQQAVYPRPGQRNPQYDLSRREARMDPALFPLARSVGAEVFADFDARLERGLQMIIAGFAVQNAKASPNS
jgi:TetR/AcrR family transcriptional regulator, tetracycline repressor protein